MNNTSIFRFLFFVLILCSIHPIAFGQSNLEEQNYYKYFDQNIGQENTALFNGNLYKKTYRTEDENHNFFINNNFVLGAIAFNNQKYYDISLKYDIYKDELIAKLRNSFGDESYVRLNKAFIEAFTIHSKDFKILNILTKSISLDGFYEVSYSSNIVSLYTKHHKLKEEYIVEKLIYNKFSKSDKNILFYNNNYYEINSKKDLKKIFPKQKKQINTFYKKNKSLKKSDNNAFIKSIIHQIEKSF